MAPWGWIAGGYGVFLALTALGLTGIAKRPLAVAACSAYALLAFGAATLVSSFWVQLIVPGALLLVGYWLSGFFYRAPQPWLERFLIASDEWVFRALTLDGVLQRTPRWVLEVLEASYTAAYVVVAAGAILAARVGIDSVVDYWTLVLAAELGCYIALPWLRSRPPRAFESPGVMARRALTLRRLNLTILDRASVQANTLPSGHVAGAVAAGLAVSSFAPLSGAVLLGTAGLIGIAAAVGRYHYVVDCVAGASVGLVAWSVLA